MKILNFFKNKNPSPPDEESFAKKMRIKADAVQKEGLEAARLRIKGHLPKILKQIEDEASDGKVMTRVNMLCESPYDGEAFGDIMAQYKIKVWGGRSSTGDLSFCLYW